LVVCEDEELIRWALCEHLTSEGYQVTDFPNGDCLSHLIAEPPDLLLLDISMPVVDGLSLLRQLHSIQLSLPIIVISVHDPSHPSVKEAVQLGMMDYVCKPFRVENVSETVVSVLHRRQSTFSQGE